MTDRENRKWGVTGYAASHISTGGPKIIHRGGWKQKATDREEGGAVYQVGDAKQEGFGGVKREFLSGEKRTNQKTRKAVKNAGHLAACLSVGRRKTRKVVSWAVQKGADRVSVR